MIEQGDQTRPRAVEVPQDQDWAPVPFQAGSDMMRPRPRGKDDDYGGLRGNIGENGASFCLSRDEAVPLLRAIWMATDATDLKRLEATFKLAEGLFLFRPTSSSNGISEVSVREQNHVAHGRISLPFVAVVDPQPWSANAPAGIPLD
jgi:hypothetical protein